MLNDSININSIGILTKPQFCKYRNTSAKILLLFTASYLLVLSGLMNGLIFAFGWKFACLG